MAENGFGRSGLGIGGLGGYIEPATVPSIEALRRYEELLDDDIVCRVCGASMNFDGAMFTTGGEDICDDCV